MRERIKEIMDKENLSAAKFADELDINRAVISHILNGRNNPSLDVVTKILSQKEYINAKWLLNGDGPMYKEGHDISNSLQKERDLFDVDEINRVDSEEQIKYGEEKELTLPIIERNNIDTQQYKTTSAATRKIKQIIIYYSDNTFETFTPH